MHKTPSGKHGLGLLLLVLPLGAAGVALAHGPCGFVTTSEASRLLGTPAGKKVDAHENSKSGCLIAAAEGPDTLRVSMVTLPEGSPALRQHMDEARGDEDSNDEPWYEISVPLAGHPDDRRLVIHRDRTVLTLDLHSHHQPNAKKSFESLWHVIAERLPFDEREEAAK
jgi:hypothetical protein